MGNLIDYIQKQLWKGRKREDIEESLLGSGYKKDAIGYAFQHLDKKHLEKHANIKFILIVLTILGVIIVAYFAYSNVFPREMIPEEILALRVTSANEIENYKQALNTNDVSLCEQTGENKNLCLAIITKDISKCDSVSIKSIDACIFDVAVKSENMDYCEQANRLKGNCYFYFATLTGDKTLCEKTGFAKNRCVEIIES
ncbi:hypothetical protein HQ529_05655 [Candidatus Woesearchaeota archaeon]|nr:hypothetical protein [Candidatus Woesearchaeota archaeon]